MGHLRKEQARGVPGVPQREGWAIYNLLHLALLDPAEEPLPSKGVGERSLLFREEEEVME